MSEHACPCGATNYSSCCEPLHLGEMKAETAQQLMRSRFSAFAKNKIDYILLTTALGQQKYLDMPAISDWAQSNQWLKLEIIRTQEKLDKNHALIEFKARYHNGQQDQIHHEVSYFVRFEDAWYFLDPTTDQKITMKQACICGSAKKFKQCCAEFI